MTEIAGQLSFDDLPDLEGLPAGERDAIVADFVSRYSDTTRTNGAKRAKPCACEGHSLIMLDALAIERRCALCGRQPRP